VRIGLLSRLIAVAVLLTACGDSGGTSSTTTSSTSASPTTTNVVTTTGVTLTDLTGTWENDALRLEVNESGEYVVRDPADPGGALMGGFVARDGEQFSFVTSTSGECPGQTGVYVARIEGDFLSLTLVDDPCDFRATGFATPLQLGG
jgi:hypothetical protein